MTGDTLDDAPEDDVEGTSGADDDEEDATTAAELDDEGDSSWISLTDDADRCLLVSLRATSFSLRFIAPYTDAYVARMASNLPIRENMNGRSV